MASVFGKPITNLEINYAAHQGQIEVGDAIEKSFFSESPASIVEVIASRGWGKTLWLVCEVLIPYMETHPGAQIMWVAPTYQIAMSPVQDVFRGSNEETGQRWVPEFDETGARVWEFKTSTQGMTLTWHTGAVVTFKSADAPESIVSRGYNFIILDEAALIPEMVFTHQILGTARKAGIKIFMITSPRGKKHWTYKYFLKGQDPSDTDYLSFQQPHYKNPFFNATQLKLVKANLPEWLFRQEYLAEFIEDGDSVFRNLDLVLEGNEITFPEAQQEWHRELVDIFTNKGAPNETVRRVKDMRFVVALDLAKSIDYTVVWVMDVYDGSCAYYRRMNKVDYKLVVKEVGKLCKRFNNAPLIYDGTGVGVAIGDFLTEEDINAHSYVFTNESKAELITKLALSIEYQEILIPNIVTVKNELNVFTYSITRTGKISYNAPAGHHDDIVIAISLANWFRKENMGIDEAVALEDILAINNRQQARRTIYDDMEDDND